MLTTIDAIDKRKVINLLFLMMGFIGGATWGFYANRHNLCKQAYAAKVDQQLEACRAWKADIDNEINEKLGKK